MEYLTILAGSGPVPRSSQRDLDAFHREEALLGETVRRERAVGLVQLDEQGATMEFPRDDRRRSAPAEGIEDGRGHRLGAVIAGGAPTTCRRRRLDHPHVEPSALIRARLLAVRRSSFSIMLGARFLYPRPPALRAHPALTRPRQDHPAHELLRPGGEVGEWGWFGGDCPDGAGVGSGGGPAFSVSVLLGVVAALYGGGAASIGTAGGFAFGAVEGGAMLCVRLATVGNPCSEEARRSRARRSRLPDRLLASK